MAILRDVTFLFLFILLTRGLIFRDENKLFWILEMIQTYTHKKTWRFKLKKKKRKKKGARARIKDSKKVFSSNRRKISEGFS